MTATARCEPAADFDALYAEYWPGAVRLAHLLTGSRALGEEIAQEAFVGLLRRGEDVREPRAYVRASIVNLATSAGRRARREREHTARLREIAVEPPELDETWEALRRLPPRQRAVLCLRFYEDLSEAEIARVLGCRPGTVKSTASRALARLQQELS